MSEPSLAVAAPGPAPAAPSTNVATLPSGSICAREGCGKRFEPRRGGKPQKYCSRKCRSRDWEAKHPRVTLDRAR